MGKVYKVRSGKNDKKTLSEALAASNGNEIELPETAVAMQVHSGLEIQIKGEPDDKK